MKQEEFNKQFPRRNNIPFVEYFKSVLGDCTSKEQNTNKSETEKKAEEPKARPIYTNVEKEEKN